MSKARLKFSRGEKPWFVQSTHFGSQLRFRPAETLVRSFLEGNNAVNSKVSKLCLFIKVTILNTNFVFYVIHKTQSFMLCRKYHCEE